MSENTPAYGELLDALRPVFVSCTSGSNAFTDVDAEICGAVMTPGNADYFYRHDPIVESVRALLLKRSQLGIAKYGCDMTRTDLELIEWHQHRLEELLDSAVYTMRIIAQMRTEMDDGK